MSNEESPEDLQRMFEPYKPDRMAWLLFKVSSYDRLEQMQRGLLYMNSLDYFSRLEEETPNPVRNDRTEKIYHRFAAGPRGKYIGKIWFEIGEGDDRQKLDAGDQAVLSVEIPSPSNVMVFCMSALADDESGKLPNEVNGQVFLDPRFLQFGDHLLVIRDQREFFRRVNTAFQDTKGLYGGGYFQGGVGLVQYVEMDNHSGHIGLFRKDVAYEWQREYRLSIGAKDEALNERGALELPIGDISDISQIVETRSFVENPITIKRSIGRIKDGQMVVEPYNPESD